MDDSIQCIIESLEVIEEDSTISKNVRTKVKCAIDILMNNGCDECIKIHQSLEALSDLCEDPNLQPYVKMQLWNVVSQLESKE